MFVFIIGAYKGYVNIYLVSNSFPDILLSSAVAIASSLLIIKLSMYTERLKLLSFIGKNSMIYLCVYLFVLETLRIYLNDLTRYLYLSEIQGNFVKLLFHVGFATIATCFILTIKKFILNSHEHNENDIIEKRNLGIDIMKRILIILIIHTIFDKDIQNWLFEYFDGFYIYHIVLSLLIQLVLGVIVGIFIKSIKKNIIK